MLKKIQSLTFFSKKDIYRLIKELYIKKSSKNDEIVITRFIIEKLLKANIKLKVTPNDYSINNYMGLNFNIRRGSSDLKVFNQVWLNKEYEPVVKILKEKDITINTIFDCGTNVGFSSLFFYKFFPHARFICIEPDRQNLNAAMKNFKINSLSNVSYINKAIWYRNSLLKLTNNFRDGQNWSISVEETDDPEIADVDAISLTELMHIHQLETIDFLKIDIEGAERYLFQSYDLANSFLQKTKCIAIEIHDEYQIRNKIYEILRHSGFEIKDFGELTIGYRVSTC